MNLKNILVAALLLPSSLLASAQGFNFDEVSYSPARTVFKLFAPGKAKNVVLNVYDKGDVAVDPKPVVKKRMRRSGDNLWTVELKGDQKGKFYTFNIGKGETPGVFAKAVGVNGKRGAIIDMEMTNPKGWADDHVLSTKNLTDEMHHRDFSIEPTSGFSNKGKFLALTEQKATDYLKRLGVNAVHILPSFDYASVDETKLDEPQFNWGYDPLNYNVPEGSYSSNPYDPAARVREFKEMVQALHKAGIRVILDVVYNHTFDLDNSNFQRTFPDYFYRFDKNGRPSNGSGCGNETASEKPMMRQFMLQSIKYWVTEYHVDGFRFDLMGVHDIETMNAIRKELASINPNVFVYGEGWSAGQCAYPVGKLAVKANMRQMPGVAAFCDDMRDALRGPFSDDKKGAFLAGIAGSEESVKAGIAGMIAHPQVDYSKVNYSKEPWALEPTQCINYVSCHDDMCLVDRLKASVPGIGTDELIRLDELAQTAVFTSQGVPFLLSGEEMLRDKKGVHNSYNSPDSVNELRWENLKRYPQVFSYYEGLISLRRNHPAFRLGNAELVRQHLEFLPSDGCLVAFRLTGHAGGDEWRNIVVVLNANKMSRSIAIPDGQYIVVCRDGIINEAGLDTIKGSQITVPAQSAIIIHD